MRIRLFIAAAIAAVVPSVVAAQTASLFGSVFRDTSGNALGGADVVMPDLKRNTTANYLGAFKFEKLPPGRHAIMIRRVGFEPLFDTVEVAAGARIERDFVLVQQATQLDSVRVTAPVKKYISPGLQGFEERRKERFGHFISEEEMRKNDQRSLIDVVVGHVPGMQRFVVKGTSATYVSSMRKCGDGPAIIGCKPGATNVCPPTMYLDGAIYYNAANEDKNGIPDLARMQTREIAGIEFYSGPATTPAKYNMTSAGCGVLLVWTRER